MTTVVGLPGIPNRFFETFDSCYVVCFYSLPYLHNIAHKFDPQEPCIVFGYPLYYCKIEMTMLFLHFSAIYPVTQGFFFKQFG